MRRYEMRTLRSLVAPLVAAGGVWACGGLGAGEPDTAEVPAGTSLVIRLDQAVSTRSTRVGQAISGTLTAPIVHEGVEVVPAGASVRGSVTAISEEPPALSARFDALESGGQVFPLAGEVRGASMVAHSEMKDEGAKIGGGAAAGAVIGGIVGGDVKGAAIGAAAGAAAGTGVALATKDRWAALSAGALLTVQLEASLEVPVPRPAAEAETDTRG
ncbi:MAG: hypothetical protein ACRELC_03285 [Gemmatimonadota bacterium]